jgi:acetoin utilization protein AcuC
MIRAVAQSDATVGVYGGAALAAYGFGRSHPFGLDRHDVFWNALELEGVAARIKRLSPVAAARAELALFHTVEYLDLVAARCATGEGYLDDGDTPAQRGIDAAAAVVVGTTLDAVRRVFAGDLGRAFVPIGGLHHGFRDRAAGFCVYDDIGVAVEWLEQQGLMRIAYVDIDAHHGDGVYYGFEEDPKLLFADIHQDGATIYPGTGAASDTGKGPGRGSKLNIPLPPGSGDDAFMAAWGEIEAFLTVLRPEFILFQCGADSIEGDPIAQLAFTPAAHAHASRRLCAIAAGCGARGLVALGGGGYDRANLAAAWTGVVRGLLESPTR